MILPFESYLAEGKVEKHSLDKNRACSLIKKAKKRIKFLREIREESADLVFEDIYEAIREASQALMALHGYKPLSHEALIAFLRDKENFDNLIIHKFDSYRKLRNKSVYEAEKISLEKVKEILEFAKKFIDRINLKIESMQPSFRRNN